MDEQSNIRKTIFDEFWIRLKSDPRVSASAIANLQEAVASSKKLKPDALIEIFDAVEESSDQD